METGSHGSNGALQRRGRIRVTQFMEIAQHDGLAVPRRQRENSAAQRRDVALAGEIGERVDFHAQRGCARVGFVVERTGEPRGPRATSEIASDAEQPELRVGLARTVPACAVYYCDECFVDDVFGERGRPAHVDGESADGGPVAAVELGEGVAIARCDTRDERVVGGMRIAHALYSPRDGKSSLRAEISWRRFWRSL